MHACTHPHVHTHPHAARAPPSTHAHQRPWQGPPMRSPIQHACSLHTPGTRTTHVHTRTAAEAQPGRARRAAVRSPRPTYTRCYLYTNTRPTHKHACTCVRAHGDRRHGHAGTRGRVNAGEQPGAHVHAGTHVHTGMSACTKSAWMCMHTHTHTCTHVCVCTHACVHVHVHTDIYVHTHTHERMHTCPYVHTHSHTRVHTLTHVCTPHAKHHGAAPTCGQPHSHCMGPGGSPAPHLPPLL